MSLLSYNSRTFGEVTLLRLVKETQIIWENSIMEKNHMIFNNNKVFLTVTY